MEKGREGGVTTPFHLYSNLDKVLHIFNNRRNKRNRGMLKCHGHEILKTHLPILQPQGIRIFCQCFHADYEIYSQILLLSTNMKYGEGGQISHLIIVF